MGLVDEALLILHLRTKCLILKIEFAGGEVGIQ